MTELAVIFGLKGPVLSPGEKVFFRDANPWGFILFARNIETPDQVRGLTASLRDCVGRNCLIFTDQEGGRVRRFRPPHWPDYPSAGQLASLYPSDPASARRAIYLLNRLMAEDLRRVGVNADCAPVLDIPVKGADPIISDRALGASPSQVIDLGNAALAGLMNGGLAPVIKHIPGHGRAMVDSHKALPLITAPLAQLETTDFAPFRRLRHAPMAMTAHAIYSHIDPLLPLTVSPKAIDRLIRKSIGFNGLLMSDDLDMKALSGNLRDKTKAALAAGCDIALQCSGDLPDMVNVTKGAKTLSGKALERARIAQYCAYDSDEIEYDALTKEFAALTTRTEQAA